MPVDLRFRFGTSRNPDFRLKLSGHMKRSIMAASRIPLTGRALWMLASVSSGMYALFLRGATVRPEGISAALAFSSSFLLDK